MIFQASKSRAFVARYSWLLVHNGTDDSNITRILSDIDILPDSDVKVSTSDGLIDIYRIKPNDPLITTTLNLAKNISYLELSLFWNKFPTAVERRKDLNNVYLKAATIVSANRLVVKLSSS